MATLAILGHFGRNSCWAGWLDVSTPGRRVGGGLGTPPLCCTMVGYYYKLAELGLERASGGQQGRPKWLPRPFWVILAKMHVGLGGFGGCFGLFGRDQRAESWPDWWCSIGRPRQPPQGAGNRARSGRASPALVGTLKILGAEA